jgi:hypothetical protein
LLTPIDYIYVFAGMLTIGIAALKRELLIEKHTFRIILALTIVLFLVGVLLHLRGATANSLAGALLTPLPSLLIFRFGRRIFIRRYERVPADTSFNWAKGLAADRFFNVVYFVSSVSLELLLMGITINLGRAGWSEN